MGQGPRLETALGGPERVLAERVLAAALQRVGAPATADLTAHVTSDIPIGYGLGSSAAFSAALFGALAVAMGRPVSPSALNDHAHALERIVHGSPSGIDDTVISRAQPVRFERDKPFRFIRAARPLRFVLASCGYPGSTLEAVAGVRRLAADEPARFEPILTRARQVVARAIAAFEAGDAVTLGPLLNANHELLVAVGVSTPELDRLVAAACQAGALGAKLTGAGRGGFVLALTPPSTEARVTRALRQAGATTVFATSAGAEEDRST